MVFHLRVRTGNWLNSMGVLAGSIVLLCCTARKDFSDSLAVSRDHPGSLEHVVDRYDVGSPLLRAADGDFHYKASASSNAGVEAFPALRSPHDSLSDTHRRSLAEIAYEVISAPLGAGDCLDQSSDFDAGNAGPDGWAADSVDVEPDGTGSSGLHCPPSQPHILWVDYSGEDLLDPWAWSGGIAIKLYGTIALVEDLVPGTGLKVTIDVGEESVAFATSLISKDGLGLSQGASVSVLLEFSGEWLSSVLMTILTDGAGQKIEVFVGQAVYSPWPQAEALCEEGTPTLCGIEYLAPLVAPPSCGTQFIWAGDQVVCFGPDGDYYLACVSSSRLLDSNCIDYPLDWVAALRVPVVPDN